MFHGHSIYFQKPNTELGDHGTVDLFYFILCEDSAWIENDWNRVWLKAQSHTLEKPCSTQHDFGSALGRPLDTSFGLSQFHGHGSWLVYEVALTCTTARSGLPGLPPAPRLSSLRPGAGRHTSHNTVAVIVPLTYPDVNAQGASTNRRLWLMKGKELLGGIASAVVSIPPFYIAPALPFLCSIGEH